MLYLYSSLSPNDFFQVLFLIVLQVTQTVVCYQRACDIIPEGRHRPLFGIAMLGFKQFNHHSLRRAAL